MAVIIYDVSIESTGTANRFLVAWKDQETGKTDSFEETIDMSREESQWWWQMPRHRLIIGKKLFTFLDGKNHFFEQALEQAKLKGDSLIINLTACRETEDWPFEILAKDTTFLLPQQLHLVRTFPHLSEQAVSPDGNERGQAKFPDILPVQRSILEVQYDIFLVRVISLRYNATSCRYNTTDRRYNAIYFPSG
jgi:hypothetical protein